MIIQLCSAARLVLSGAAIFVLVSLVTEAARAGEPPKLDNGIISAEFGPTGMVRITNAASRWSVALAEAPVTLVLDGERISPPALKLTGSERRETSIAYSYQAGDRRLEAVYELKPGWHFVSKRLVLTLPAGATCRVGNVEVLRAKIASPVAREHRASRPSGAVFLRLGDKGQTPTNGLFLVLQNPFLTWQRKERQVAMSYTADMKWRAEYGPFESDRVCLGPYALGGVRLPLRGPGEWKYVPNPETYFDDKPFLDWAETDALTRCVAAFVMRPVQRSVKVHIGWCENDYQIDMATEEGRKEYKRIIDQAAAVGCEDVLFTPANGALAPLKGNTDAWGWENVLWLGIGQKIRRGEWDPAKDAVPPIVREMLDYAASKRVRLMAYVYPTLGYKQDPEWTKWCGGKTGGYVGVDTGVRSFQDWFVDKLVAFQKRTGVSGYSFDHWWIAYDKASSKYAQWYGCRRILEELRRRIPDVIIDGRQQYQWFGTWTWLGGSYPHPTTNDEQPGSFENFPDLHFDRCSADRQRRAAWYYRMEQFTPLDLVPGYMTHQTPRNDAKGRCIRDRAFRARDWDLLGWRYSVLSSIGTAPFNHVMSMLPARDEAEFKAFSDADRAWLRGWLKWTDRNLTVLRNLRPIIGPPMLGRIDGTAAVAGGRGFVFLFNPNYRRIDASFALDASIGLSGKGPFVLRELFPRKGLLIGKPGGPLWDGGDRVRLPVKGPQAVVLELVPAAELTRPVLFGAVGKARMEGETLVLDDVAGETGTRADLAVLLPAGAAPGKVRLNGADRKDFQRRGDVLSLAVGFAGERLGHCPQVGRYDPVFAGGTYSAELRIPRIAASQMDRRRHRWPVPYTADDLECTWLGSDRLLLYMHIADPDDKMAVGLTIDGKTVKVWKAYSAIYPNGRKRTFVGFYADVSALTAGAAHRVEVALPKLQPGQFQGLFLENVEPEYTTQIAR